MSTASNNGSAYAYLTTLPTGDFRLAFWAKASTGVISHGDFSQLFEIGYGSGNYVQLYSNSGDATPELRRWRNEAGDDQQVISNTLYVDQWIRIGLERTGTTWTVYYADVDDTSWTTVTSWTNANAWASLCFLGAYISLGSYIMPGASMRSARLYTGNTMSQVLADLLSATPTLGSLWAAWFDGSSASLDGSDSSGNTRPLTVSGTFVSDGADPIASGTVGLTGLGLGIALAAGQLANTPQVITGQSLGIGAAAGVLSLGAAPSNIPQWFSEKLLKPRWFDRSLERAAWFSRYYADDGSAPSGLTGLGLGISVSHGSLGVSGALGVAGLTAAIATAVGSVSIPPDSLVGRALAIAAAAGNLGPSGAYTLSGQTLAIAGANGAIGSATGIGPAGQFLGLALAAGALGAVDSFGLTGQGVGVGVSHGSLGAASAYSLAGQALTIATAVGAVTPPGTLAGQGANIATATGTLGTSGTLGVTGQFLGVAVSHGSVGAQGAQALVGSTAAIAAAVGTLATPGGGTLTGLVLGVAASHGALGAFGAASLTGGAAAIAVSHGTLGSSPAVSGQSLGILASAGNLGSGAALPMTGRFVGIALAAGAVGLPGESVTRTPTGQNANIATQAAWLTWVEYGPPVDAALRDKHIADNDAITQYEVANVWRWHQPAGAELPKGFPYTPRLNAAGYTLVRQIKAASADDLNAAGFNLRQIAAILTAAEKL